MFEKFIQKIKFNPHFMNRYVKFIKQIQALGSRDLEVFERHHILPRCIWPEFENLIEHRWNRIDLTPKEHFIAHLILMKAIDDYRLTLPITLMGENSKLYSTFRVRFIEALSKKITGLWKPPEFRNKQMKIRSSKEYKDRVNPILSEAAKLSYKNGRVSPLKGVSKSEIEKKLLSEIQIQLWKDPEYRKKQHSTRATQEYKEKMSQHWENLRNSGWQNPLKNKTRPKSVRESISKGRLGIKCKIVTCPYCGKQGGGGNMTRYHFEACPSKPVSYEE